MNLPLTTRAEQSNYQETGRIDEVERLSAQLTSRWPDSVRSIEYGRSVEDRPLRALLISRVGTLSAQELRRHKIPILLIQAGIHPGESDGKDAGFIAIRDMLEDRTTPGALERIALLFVPAFNTDGHERTGRWNRPNQAGPEETGWRTTAQNLNLNRDYVKADAPEMQAMLRLLDEWDPLICADLHVTDGADFEADISNQVEPLNQGDPMLRAIGLRLREELNATLSRQGWIALPFYPDLARTDDPESGFLLSVYSPRFSTGYFPQRNRITVLVETHSWKPYARRVRLMRHVLLGLTELVAAQGPNWLAKAHQADVVATRLGGTELALDYNSGWREPVKPGSQSQGPDSAGASVIDFPGYAYSRKPSPISGALVTVYDPSTPQTWRVPFRDRITPSLIVTTPQGGYVVPQAFAREIGAKLDLHGIAYSCLQTPRSPVSVEAFRASHVKFSPAPFEGRQRAQLEGCWKTEMREVGVGDLFVPIAQRLARLIVAMFEPQAPDSFAAWGFFNACFEQKEHLEPYVSEQIAHEMLARDAALQVEFHRRLQEDAEFAADSSARLEFFLKRHPSWDERFNLYPVLRLERPLGASPP